jgi:hypothetical protein
MYDILPKLVLSQEEQQKDGWHQQYYQVTTFSSAEKCGQLCQCTQIYFAERDPFSKHSVPAARLSMRVI